MIALGNTGDKHLWSAMTAVRLGVGPLPAWWSKKESTLGWCWHSFTHTPMPWHILDPHAGALWAGSQTSPLSSFVLAESGVGSATRPKGWMIGSQQQLGMVCDCGKLGPNPRNPTARPTSWWTLCERSQGFLEGHMLLECYNWNARSKQLTYTVQVVHLSRENL